MALNNYNDLTAAVANWSHRSDLLSPRIAECVALAEARMSADLSQTALEKVQNVTITASVATLPADALQVLALRLSVGTRRQIEITSREELQRLREATYAGPTTYAAILGRTVETYPTTSGTMEVHAKCRVPSLEAASTNWVMTNFPNVYLFSTLAEIAGHLQDTEQVAIWVARYTDAVAQANAAVLPRVRNGQSRVWGVR